MCNQLSRLFLPLLLLMSFCGRDLVFGQSTQIDSEESSTLTYHSAVSEVRLVFVATDEHNRPVPTLQKDDFAVVDNEMVIRNFRSFTHSELARLDVVVLVDSSESVLPSFQREITDVQQLISQWPWNSEDQLSVLSFSGMETHFVCAGDCRSSFSADRLSRGGPTPLFDALETATKYLAQRRQPDVLPVIVLFSDGEDTISRASFREVLAKILATEAQVYAVDVGTSAQASNGTATLQKIADDSGGRRVPISEGVAGIFNDVINDLHSARVVTYLRPESVSDFHSIRILPTRNLNLQFRCRRGYYSQAGSSHSEDGP